MAGTDFTPEPGFTPIHREEVVSALNESYQAFNELSSIFDAIRHGNGADPVFLASAGRRISEDLAGFIDSIHEQAKKGGVKQ